MAALVSSFRRDRPVISEPGLAIWSYPTAPATSPDLTLKLEADFGSRFFLGASKTTPLYLRVYSRLSHGPKLTVAEVATLVHGGSVIAEFTPSSPSRPSYRAHLAIGDIQKVPWKSQADKYDRILRFGRALPLDQTGESRTSAWEVDKIIFPRWIKPATDSLKFEPAHAFQCLRLGECQIQDYRVTYAGLANQAAAAHPSAKLQFSLLPAQTREELFQSSSATLMQ